MRLEFPEIRRALRRLRRARAFSLAAAATVALGVGATAAVFTVLHGVILRPLPYVDADRLVTFGHRAPGLGVEEGGQSDGTFLHYRAHNRVFEETGAYLRNVVSITDEENPERVEAAVVTPEVLPMLGVVPLHGRLFTPADTAAEARPGVLLGYSLWERRYGSDPEIVGRTIELNRNPREVIGVLPPGFSFPDAATQVWYRMDLEASEGALNDLYLSGIARLRRGVDPDAAAADLQRLVGTLPEAYSDVSADLLQSAQIRTIVQPLHGVVVRQVRQPLVLLMWTAVFVLFIACANVVNLFLVRAERQRQEVTVERALGASGGDLARRCFAESLIITAAGGVAGLALAYVAVRSNLGFAAGDIPRLHEVRFGAASIAFVFGIVMFVGVVLGAITLTRSARGGINAGLRDVGGAAGRGRGWSRFGRLLVSVQVGLALTLLVASVAMVRSFVRLNAAELGFDSQQTLTFDIALPPRQYRAHADAAAFYARLLEELRALPGVSHAGAASSLPLMSVATSAVEPMVPEDWAGTAAAVPPRATVTLATPGYFEAMRMSLLAGRVFDESDRSPGVHPVVISEGMARTLFRDGDAVGRRVRLADRDETAYTVVGVVGGVPGARIADGPANAAYFPVVAGGEEPPPLPLIPRELSVVVRADGAPASLVPLVRGTVHGLDPKLPLSRVSTLDQMVDDSAAPTRLTAALLLVAAGAALFLGLVGIYGVVAYGVSQRTPEFGVRLALGATPEAIRGMVLAQSAALAAVGIGLGIGAAWVLGRVMITLVYDVSPHDPAAFAAVATLLFLVTLGASVIPAFRAGRIDPARAIKAE
jgi:putative ABC transport system permease protein